MEPQQLIHFINLGMLLEKFTRPFDMKTFGEMQDQSVSMLRTLDAVGFAQEERALMALLAGMHAAKDEDTKFDWLTAPENTKEYYNEFNRIIRRVYQRMSTELASRQALLVDQGAVSERLRNLRETITGSEKQIIFADTLRCLETGAYRAAIVMGWNLAYEHFRRWIFKSKRKRLRNFNTELTGRHKNKTSNHDPISIFEDFYDLKESMVVDVAHKAQLIEKQKMQVLTGALNDRNHFAHPNSRRATAATATGYIENLIVNILDDPDLAYKE